MEYNNLWFCHLKKYLIELYPSHILFICTWRAIYVKDNGQFNDCRYLLGSTRHIWVLQISLLSKKKSDTHYFIQNCNTNQYGPVARVSIILSSKIHKHTKRYFHHLAPFWTGVCSVTFLILTIWKKLLLKINRKFNFLSICGLSFFIGIFFLEIFQY